MAFGHFTSRWNVPCRRGGVLRSSPTIFFRFVSNGLFQLNSHCRMASESQSGKSAWEYNQPCSSEENMKGILASDQVSRRPVLLQCGSYSHSRLSSNWPFSVRNRLIHSHAFDWQRSLAKASSWNYFLSLEKAVRRELDSEEYREFVEACERRLVELYREGRLSVDDLPSVVRRQCGEWHALFLAVGCASRLAKGDTKMDGGFSLEKMDKFLLEINIHRGHERARCERLQPMVNALKKNMRNASSECVLSVLYSVAHIKSKSLSVYELMVGVERLYGKRLRELTPQELVWFAAASSRISKKEKRYDCRALLVSLLEEYSCRLSEFSSHQCIQMLYTMSFCMPSGPLSNERILLDTENHVAPALSSQSLSSKEVAQLSATFTHFAYATEKVSFRDVLYNQMGSFTGRQLVQVFHYVSKCGVIDAALLERLHPCIHQHINGLQEKNIRILLGSLALPGVRDVPGCRECAFLLETEIVKRMSVNPKAFSPTDSAGILYMLPHLSIVKSAAVKVLFGSAIGEFERLPNREMAQLVYGVSQLKENEKYVAALCDGIRRTDIQAKQLRLSGIVLVCKGLVGMRYADKLWLREVVRFCGEDLSVLMSKDLNTMSIVLHSLSYLDYDCAGLFRDVETWLLEHGALVSKLGWSEDIIQILWASVVQDVFPVEVFQRLSKCAAPSFKELAVEGVLRLHELSAILHHQEQMDILPPETYSALCQYVKCHNRVIPDSVKACLRSIVHSYPSGYVRENVVTAEGLHINCALLQSSEGTFIDWPACVSEELSMAEMETVHRSGYQPLALLVRERTWFDLSQRMLGSLVMTSKALSACGWDVCVISVSEYNRDTDKKSFLQSVLAKERRK